MKLNNMIKNLGVFSLLTTLFLYNISLGESKSKVGTTVYPFLEIGAGARASGLGEAYVALATNVTGLYWNPAGIADARNEVTFDNTKWFANLKYNFFGVITNFGPYGSVGLSMSSFNSGRINVTTALRPEGTGETYELSDIALGLSYAKKLTDRFNIGGTAKYIHSSLWDMQTSALAFDIGTLFKSPLFGLTIGMSISNFGSEVRYDGANSIIRHDIDPLHSGNNDKILGYLRTNTWDLPLLFRFGLARAINMMGLGTITVSLDALHPNNNEESLNFGMEYAFRQAIFLRAGYKSFGLEDSQEGLSFGGGVVYKLLRFDYAYSDFGLLDNVQRFSFSLLF